MLLKKIDNLVTCSEGADQVVCQPLYIVLECVQLYVYVLKWSRL